MAKGHHICYERWGWEAKGKNGAIRPAQRIRRMPGLIVEELYNTEEHDALHRDIGTVPVPSYVLSNSILKRYTDSPDDHLESVDNLIRATHLAIERPKIRPIERELGLLIIKSVELQIPYIQAVL